MQEHRAAGWWRSSPPAVRCVRDLRPCAQCARRRSSSSSATSSPTTRPRARRSSSSPSARPSCTKGKVKIEVYANSASSTRTRKRWRRCSSARCRCSRPRSPKFGPLGAKEFEVFDLPFIFDSYGRAAQGHAGAGRQAAARQARRQGHQGPRVLGQRLQVVLGEQGAQDASRLQGHEDADLDSAFEADRSDQRCHEDMLIISTEIHQKSKSMENK